MKKRAVKDGLGFAARLCTAANSPLKARKPGPDPVREIRGIARLLSASIH
jgi:hypothetical protein